MGTLTLVHVRAHAGVYVSYCHKVLRSSTISGDCSVLTVRGRPSATPTQAGSSSDYAGLATTTLDWGDKQLNHELAN